MSLFLREDTFNHDFINDFMHRISQPLTPELIQAAKDDKDLDKSSHSYESSQLEEEHKDQPKRPSAAE